MDMNGEDETVVLAGQGQKTRYFVFQISPVILDLRIYLPGNLLVCVWGLDYKALGHCHIELWLEPSREQPRLCSGLFPFKKVCFHAAL